MTTYVLIDEDEDTIEFSNKDEMIQQMASWLNMRVWRK